MHVLWVHVSVNFGNRYLDGLFAIFHYACEHRGSFPCEARERELLNDYERSACEWEEGVLGYFFYPTRFGKFNNRRGRGSEL